MHILVINGSPSGDSSITLQTALFLEQSFKEHSFSYINAASKIRYYEQHFDEVKPQLEQADLILFAYPVYTFLVPSQLHRFIELMKEHIDLHGKYASQITTSKHFYDITAHRFIQDACDDMRMHYVRGLSADMEDLLSKQGQEDALAFFRYVLFNMRNDLHEPRYYREKKTASYPLPAPLEKKNVLKPWKIAVVCDLSSDTDGRLAAMIARFQNAIGAETKVIRLDEFPFKGGCLGCFRCAAEGSCIYTDGFDSFLRDNIQTCDATVYAFTIRDHSMGYLFKVFDDRQFCNGHRTVTMGKPVGYLVNGDLREEFNLKTVMEARAEVGGNFLTYIASDTDNIETDIDTLAQRMTYALDHGYETPKNFYGVGGLKIFRDLIWQMQGLMQEDHRFYKEHGFYNDFPQKHRAKTAAMYLVGSLMRNKKLSSKIGSKMTEGMVMPYKAVIEKAKKKN